MISSTNVDVMLSPSLIFPRKHETLTQCIFNIGLAFAVWQVVFKHLGFRGRFSKRSSHKYLAFSGNVNISNFLLETTLLFSFDGKYRTRIFVQYIS